MNKKSIAHTLGLFIDSVLSDVHTAMPGKVEKYEYDKQRANVKPLVRRRYSDGTEVDFPVIAGVPVVFPRSAKASLTFPLEVGDTGLIIFCERSLDRWLSKGGVTDSVYSRKFDLSDAVFIPGMYPFSEASPAVYDKMQIKYHNATVVIDKGGTVDINDGNLTVDL